MTEPLLVSLRVVGMALGAIALLGVPIALYLAKARGVFGQVLELVVLIPMFLPPTVLGYFLLVALGSGSPLVEWLGIELLFTTAGAAVAATAVGLPLMVMSSRAAFAGVDPRLESVARTLGASEWRVFVDVTLPLARRGVAAGLLLGAARATGEFGATLMVAGSIPGRTRTLPIALYDAIQLGDGDVALSIVLALTGWSVAALLLLRRFERGRR